MIHYQIPASVDIYVHRSGRTARGSADGLAVALVAPKEAARYAALQQVQIAWSMPAAFIKVCSVLQHTCVDIFVYCNSMLSTLLPGAMAKLCVVPGCLCKQLLHMVDAEKLQFVIAGAGQA